MSKLTEVSFFISSCNSSIASIFCVDEFVQSY